MKLVHKKPPSGKNAAKHPVDGQSGIQRRLQPKEKAVKVKKK